MQQKTPSKLAVFFIFQKDILGIISPCKLPKIPLKNRRFCHQKRDIFDTQSTVRCEKTSTPDGTMYLQKTDILFGRNYFLSSIKLFMTFARQLITRGLFSGLFLNTAYAWNISCAILILLPRDMLSVNA